MQLDGIKYIEFFGVPGSGKTYIRNEIKKILEKSDLKILDTRELIISEYESVIKLDFLERQTIKYFRLLNFIKSKNIKSKTKKVIPQNNNYKKKNLISTFNNVTVHFKEKYEDICKKILLKNIKSKKIYRFIKKILRESKDVKKNHYHFWFVESLAATSIFEKIKSKSNIIYFPDEAFIQRAFLLNRLTQPKNANIIKKYLKITSKAELIFNISSKKEKIYNAHTLRKVNNSDFLMNKTEIDKMIEFKKKFLRDYINFDFKTIENNSNLKKTLKNYFKN